MPDGTLQNKQLLGIINRVSSETGVPSNILAAVAQQETGGKWYDKVSDGTGHSYGYMMLYDNGAIADARQQHGNAYAEKAKTDPYTNVLVGANLLKKNYKNYGNWEQALAKYNGTGSAAQAYGKKVWDRANSAEYKSLSGGSTGSSFLGGFLGVGKDKKTEQIQSTASKILDSNGVKQPKIANPFVKADGELVNPFLNYQQILDNPNTSNRVKKFIQDATGLGSAIVETTESSGVPTTGNKITDSAMEFMGKPYVWGGDSDSDGGYDCSGFVYAALKNAGYNIGRTTAEGFRRMGTPVDKENLQPGDMVFWGSGGEATHTGFYIGGGKVVQSSGGSKNTKSNPGKGVCIKDLNYRSDYMGARRL